MGVYKFACHGSSASRRCRTGRVFSIVSVGCRQHNSWRQPVGFGMHAGECFRNQRCQRGRITLEQLSRNSCASLLKACGVSLSTSIVPTTISLAESNTGTMISDLVVLNAVR